MKYEIFQVNPHLLKSLEKYLRSMPDWYLNELLGQTDLVLNGDERTWDRYIERDGSIKTTDSIGLSSKRLNLAALLFFFTAWKRNPENGDVSEVVIWLNDCLLDIYNHSPYWQNKGTYFENTGYQIENQIGSRGMGTMTSTGDYELLIGPHYQLKNSGDFVWSSDGLVNYIESDDIVNGLAGGAGLKELWTRLSICIPTLILSPQHYLKPFLNYSEKSFKALKV